MSAYAALYAQSIERLKALGGTPVEIDYAPFRDAAQLLYDGPWVAERTAAVGKFIDSADDKAGVWPTTRQIVLGGRTYSAVDAFEGQYKLAALEGACRGRDEGPRLSRAADRGHDLSRGRSSSASRCSSTAISATTPTS